MKSSWRGRKNICDNAWLTTDPAWGRGTCPHCTGSPCPDACGVRDIDESSIKCCSNHCRRDAWGGPAYTPLADSNRYQSDLERVCGWRYRLSVDCRIPVSQTQCLAASRVHLRELGTGWDMLFQLPRPALPSIASSSPSFSHEPEVKTRTLGGPHHTLGTVAGYTSGHLLLRYNICVAQAGLPTQGPLV